MAQGESTRHLGEIIMANIIVYSTSHCPYCERAKSLLTAKGVDYTVVDVESDTEKLSEMLARSQRRTVPQIFINDYHVGGYDDLYALDSAGELDQLLNEETP